MRPVVLMESGGVPRVNAEGATPAVVVETGGVGITLVEAGAPPITLLNADGTPWEAEV